MGGVECEHMSGKEAFLRETLGVNGASHAQLRFHKDFCGGNAVRVAVTKDMVKQLRRKSDCHPTAFHYFPDCQFQRKVNVK